MFFPFHGQSKAISTMVTPPPFGLPMAHPPWSGADCYQWLFCCNGEAVGAVEVGIGHTHHRHGSSLHFRQALDTFSAQELVCFSPPPPPKPPWPPPWHKNINTNHPPQLFSNPPFRHTVPPSSHRMSGRHKKKQAASSAEGARLPSSQSNSHVFRSHPSSP
jgi:hypothetical protein